MRGIGQRAWVVTLAEDRLKEAKAAYEKLQSIPFADLSKADRAVMGVLGYLTLDSDEGIASLLEVDLSAPLWDNE